MSVSNEMKFVVASDPGWRTTRQFQSATKAVLDNCQKKRRDWRQRLTDHAKDMGTTVDKLTEWPPKFRIDSMANMADDTAELHRMDSFEQSLIKEAEKNGSHVATLRLNYYRWYIIRAIVNFCEHVSLKGGSSLSLVYKISHRLSRDMDIKIPHLNSVPLTSIETDTKVARKNDCRRVCDELLKVLPKGWRLVAFFRPEDSDYRTAALEVTPASSELVVLIDLCLDSSYKPDEWNESLMSSEVFTHSQVKVRVLKLEITLLEKMDAIQKRFPRADDSFVRHYLDVSTLLRSVEASQVPQHYQTMMADSRMGTLNNTSVCWNPSLWSSDQKAKLHSAMLRMSHDWKEEDLLECCDRARELMATIEPQKED